ncbi:MAG: inorganic phosphate transporter [Clostridia bacterium]|nr:inorganic phosphate transporter [Clostridia bacterium]
MSLAFILSILLVLSVVFVNGWTDAPNAIGSAVATKVLRPRLAIIVAVIFNFLGVLLMTYISSEVADTITNMVDFGPSGSEQSLIVLTAAMFSIVIWAVAAWYFGIPTSESHALIAGITGAALALGGVSAVNMKEWSKVLVGLVVSSVLGFGAGFGVARFIEKAFRRVNRQKAESFFSKGQAAAASVMAFLHGAQDGQKFMGVFMIALFLNGMAEKTAEGTFVIPIGVMVLCSVVMGLGTMVGGWRIIKTVGMDMVKMQTYQGFSSDIAAGACLLFASLTGIPVSTTHTKTTAIMGVGTSRRASSVNWRIALEMIYAWVLTFPGCGLIGYLMAKLFMAIF